MDAAAVAWGNMLLALSLFGTAWAWLTRAGAHSRGRCCCGCRFPFTRILWPIGSVPIFLPVWWPHSWYNTRYGMELLPAFALGLGFAAQFVLSAPCASSSRRGQVTRRPCSFALVAFNAWQMVRERPLVYVEGTKNIDARRPFEQQIPPVLRALLATRPGGVVLMNTSVYPELVAFTGIPLRQTINESDQRVLRRCAGRARRHAAIVLAFDGDEMDQRREGASRGADRRAPLHRPRPALGHDLRLRYPRALNNDHER